MKIGKICFYLFLGLFCLFIVINRSWSEDDGEQNNANGLEDPVVEEVSPDSLNLYSSCEKPPDGAVPVDYTILSITHHNETSPDPADNVNEKTSPLSVYDRQIIETEEEYIRIFGAPSDGIDWKNQRILVYLEMTCYRFNDLEYTSYLSGVYVYGDTMYIGTTTTHHGPCQGIHQDMSWFSFQFQGLYLLLPKLPEKITYIHCSIGGCPPDIP